MAGRRVDAVALSAAMALHAVALGALRVVPLPAALQPPRPPSAGIEVDLIVATEPPLGKTTPAPATARQAPDARPLAMVASLAPRRVGVEGTGASSAGPEPGGLEPDGSANGSSDESAGSRQEPRTGAPGGPSLSLAQLGVEGRLGYPIVPRSPQPSANQTAAARLRRALARPVAERDAELGLGPHGPIVGALEHAAHRGATPLNATALFRARVDERGRLVELTLLEASEGYRAWREVGQSAQQALAVRTLQLPDGSQGVALEIRVVSREQLPSGADPGVGVSLFRVPLKRGKGDRSASIDILRPELDLDTVEIPNPSGEPLRLPQLKIGLALLNLGVDPADIGQHGRRVVSAEVVATEPL